MTASELSLWVAALAVPFGGTAAFLKWYIARIDTKQAVRDAAGVEAQERLDEAVEARFMAQEQRMTDMSAAMAEQQQTIKQLRDLLDVYIRHTGRLEVLLARAGVDIPEVQLNSPTGRMI